jgi:hypothetical protein
MADHHLDLIRQLQWRVAKTMPEIPHQYTTRKPDDPVLEAAYCALHGFIESSEVRERWKGRRKRYLYPGDGWKYWNMGALFVHGNVVCSRVINRMKIEDDLHRLRVQDPQAAAAAERHLTDASRGNP